MALRGAIFQRESNVLLNPYRFGSTAPPPADLTTGLVTLWPLSSANNNCRADTAGSLTLTYTNAPTCSSGYTTFNGTNQYGAYTSNNSTLNGATKIAVAAWIKPSTTSQLATILALSTGVTTTTRWLLRLGIGRDIEVLWRDADNESGSSTTVNGVLTAALDTWQLLICHWDSEANTVVCWLGGTQALYYVGDFTALGSNSAVRTRIGASIATTPANYWAGGLARIRIYKNRLLNTIDRAALLSEGSP